MPLLVRVADKIDISGLGVLKSIFNERVVCPLLVGVVMSEFERAAKVSPVWAAVKIYC